ncbi:MAG: 50S ribosomal protein L32 [Parcubacteria group bacterium CG11_big_fil_rev_8_21_14_0_20_39_22]|nr:MAG: 50S ribosomal protein L32 [Parcubacteria group bacterium CG11_big_fil_rev_8_21_14_0_20_39_22]
MVIRMRHTRSHTKNRRSHHRLVFPRLSKCKECGSMHVRHRVCVTCGKYKGREVVNVQAKIDKKVKKQKENEKAQAKG